MGIQYEYDWYGNEQKIVFILFTQFKLVHIFKILLAKISDEV